MKTNFIFGQEVYVVQGFYKGQIGVVKEVKYGAFGLEYGVLIQVPTNGGNTEGRMIYVEEEELNKLKEE